MTVTLDKQILQIIPEEEKGYYYKFSPNIIKIMKLMNLSKKILQNFYNFQPEIDKSLKVSSRNKGNENNLHKI